jgi:aryl-alcohol dehydrogenase-like predicted oxidoreductase
MLGASKREQLAQNLDALDLLPKLDASIAKRLREVVAG